MKNHPDNSEPLEPRYFINLALKDFLKKKRVDFELYNPDIDSHLVEKIAGINGFNSNHPNFAELIRQIQRTFTLAEISQLVGSLSSLEILELNVEVAVFQVSDQLALKKGQMAVRVSQVIEDYDFSTQEGYSLPFVVKGTYDPYQTC